MSKLILKLSFFVVQGFLLSLSFTALIGLIILLFSLSPSNFSIFIESSAFLVMIGDDPFANVFWHLLSPIEPES